MKLRRIITKTAFAAAFFIICSPAFAVLFTAADKSFTIDLPSSWQRVEPVGDEVLSLKRDNAAMKISQIPACNNFNCIDARVNKDLDFVKAKKFRVLENTYSGEIIKRTEFSTGDPLLSFNYSVAAVDFTTAYFLADGKAYYVGIKGIPYVEADLILSFIAPAAKPTDATQGAPAPRHPGTDIYDEYIDEDEAPLPLKPAAPAQPAAPVPAKRDAAYDFDGVKIGFVLTGVYFLIFFMAFALRMFMPGKITAAANPRSSYPVKGMRLYGSPDLFFKLHDNQGNNYIATCSRWGSIFMGFGLATAVFFFALKINADYAYTNGLLTVHVAIVNTVVSLSALLSVLGLIIFALGLMLNLLFTSKYYLYSDKGALVFKCVRKGFHPFREEYVAVDDKSAIIFRMRRDRFTPQRRWLIYDNTDKIAVIQEQSFIKAILRMLLGHMCGFLRADYDIKARMGSSGKILSYGRIFTYLRAEIDKPDAVNSAIILTACAVIFMRDRDKWHPWVN